MVPLCEILIRSHEVQFVHVVLAVFCQFRVAFTFVSDRRNPIPYDVLCPSSSSKAIICFLFHLRRKTTVGYGGKIWRQSLHCQSE